MIRSISPATGEVLAEFEESTSSEIEARLTKSLAAFSSWRRFSFDERGALMHNVATLLRDEAADIARLITVEMGKPITEAEAEVQKCAGACDYFADNGAQFLADETPADAPEARIAFQPLGPVLAIMPWNFPFWQVFRFSSPALMAGCTGLLKHSSNVPQCALKIEDLFRRAGFPDGVFQTLLIGGSAAEEIIADDRVAAVTLTGSEYAGSRVAAAAGRSLKKTVLELGGSDPFIVLPDAEVEKACAGGVRARYQNSGQSCIAAKRFIVAAECADEFERFFVEAVRSLSVGDPMDRLTQIGPLAREDLCDVLDLQVKESIRMGAQPLTGGGRIERRGYFYAPTVLTGVTPGMPVSREETFGPVAAIMRAKSIDHAIELANDTVYGLGASIWTRDSSRARSLANDISAGVVSINRMVASDQRIPFGGVKRSGYGRELSQFGIREFVNVQAIMSEPDNVDA